MNVSPVQGSDAAMKLRDLNALYKEGLIDKHDFNTKKAEILKAL